jgi:hypothetical protein
LGWRIALAGSGKGLSFSNQGTMLALLMVALS